MVAISVYRASNVWVDACNSSCLVLQLQSVEVPRTVTSSFVWSWTISINVNEGTKIPRIELSTVHLYQHYSLFMPNKLQYTWSWDYCECVRPAQLSVLTEVRAPSLLDQYPRYVPHRDGAGYNNMHLFIKIRSREICLWAGLFNYELFLADKCNFGLSFF